MNSLSFDKIEYTPGWYYSRWPGFYNMDNYVLMAKYSENNGTVNENKKRSRSKVEKENTKKKRVENESELDATELEVTSETGG